MDQFKNIETGELFTTCRPINGRSDPAVWRKRSTRTAELASGKSAIINRPRWFYFRQTETAHKWEG